jgi:monoamine oxidase
MAKIAVVGAGAAGLMAALELRSAGHDVVVLESRDRVGGRIHTVRFRDGLWANAGAEWLNRSDAIAHELVDKYGLHLTPRSGFEGVVMGGTLYRSPHEGRRKVEIIEAEIDRLAASLTNLDAPWDDPIARLLDQQSIAEWVEGLDFIDDEARDLYFTWVRGEFMVEPTELSLAARIFERALTDDTGYARFTDGTASLVEAMAHDIGFDRILLDEPVSRLTHDEQGVTVSSAHRDHRVDAVIVTAPLPALARMTIEPAIEVPQVGQGRGGKLLMPYDSRAWDDAAPEGHADTAAVYVYHSASHRDRADGVLVAYSLEVLDDQSVTAAFSTWFPALGDQPAEAPIAAWWSEDPNSGTTYSAPRPGELDALKRLREPFGRIHLAGEHTEVLFGYIESALASGRRVARTIAQTHSR